MTLTYEFGSPQRVSLLCICRAFDHIFETIQVSEGSKYLVHASYLEIYNEEVRDLLGKDIKHRLELKEHPEKGVYVQSWFILIILFLSYADDFYAKCYSNCTLFITV